MSWEWDRGSTSRDPFSWGNKDGDQDYGQLLDYAETREIEDAEIDQLRGNPAVVAMISKRVKKSIGRTAELPIMCGVRRIERSLAFGIREGMAELVIVWDHESTFTDTAPSRTQARLTGPETSNTPMQFTCLCDATHGPGGSRMALTSKRQGSRRTRLWLYKAALAALASDTRRRPAVQLHT